MTEALTVRSMPARRDRDELQGFFFRTTSPDTRRSYERVIKDFWEFIQGIHPDMTDLRLDCYRITSEDLQQWRDLMISTTSETTGNRRRPATVAHALGVIAALFDWLGIAPNPAHRTRVQRPVVNNTRTDFLRPGQIRNILAGPDRSSVEGARDYAILKMLFRMIPRRSELARLKVDDISGSPGRWKIRYVLKGGREFWKPMPDEVKQAIDEYLALDRDRRLKLKSYGCADLDAPIFQPTVNYRSGNYKKGLDGSMIYRIFNRWVKYAGYQQGAYPHAARASFATAAFKKEGVKVDQIMAAGGWASERMPLKYNKAGNDLDRNAISLVNLEEGD